MRYKWTGLTFALMSCLWAAGLPHRAAAGEQAQEPISFSKQVLPILSENCFRCHGETQQLSKLDARSRAGLLKGGQHGPAMVPGDAERSRLYQRVAGLEQPSMPFDGELDESEIEILRDWINQGAPWDGPEIAAMLDQQPKTTISGSDPGFWAFRKPGRPPVPRVKNADWSRHPVDAFLAKAMEEKGLTPAPMADRYTLVRRAYLDLIGLPPSPEEVLAFVNDQTPDAWEKLIERLLDSPHYGERWGRHWLDVARYADSAGYEHDRDRPTAWRYRDYVIRSFNKDTPHNVFIAEQLAGDELDWTTFDTKVATGFLRVGPRVEFREKDNPQYRFDYLDDMIATTAQGFLGLSAQCARCHDHKFDPIPQTDYYRLQAAFFPYVDVNHYLAAEDEVKKFLSRKQEIEEQIKNVRQRLAEIEAPYRESVFVAEVLSRFPEDARVAVTTPEEKRTPGQRLLATQLLRAVGVPGDALDRALSPEDKQKKTELLAEIKRLEGQLPEEPPSALGVTDGDYRFAPDSHGDEPAPGKGVKRDLNLKGNFLHTGEGPYQPPPSYFLISGDLESRGPQMEPGFIAAITNGDSFPTAIPPAHGRTSGRRRALAEWIGSPENPLTARVIVNRIWHHHFGRGIVASLNNFGKVGERATHPELLDWLACEFMARGGSIKQMHRLIMTSNAYRMSSQFHSDVNEKVDPENRMLWRFRMQRLDAEVLRDSILTVSGKLNRTIGGPPVFPKLDPSVLASMKNGIWNKHEEGPETWRRSVYIYRKRGLPFPFLQVFDLPDQNVTCPQRYVSTVPTQALTMLNNEFLLQHAEFLADRITGEAGSDGEAQLSRAYWLTLGREITDQEKRLGLEFLQKMTLSDLAHVLLNLNEFIYMR